MVGRIDDTELSNLRRMKAEMDAAMATARVKAAMLESQTADLYLRHGKLLGVDIICFDCGAFTTKEKGCDCTKEQR